MDRSMTPVPPGGHSAMTGWAAGPPVAMPAWGRPASTKAAADYLRAMKKRYWLALAVALAVIPLGTIQVLKMPDKYRTTARVRIEPPRFDDRLMAILPGAVGYSGRDGQEHYVPDRMAALRSVGLFERVASDPDLNLSPSETGQAIAELAGLQTRPYPGSNTYDLTIEGTDRARITALLNGLIQLFSQESRSESSGVLDRSQRRASESAAKMQAELKTLDARIESALNGSNLFGVGGRSLQEEKYLQLTSLLASRQAQYDQLVQQIRVNRMASPRGFGEHVAHPHAQEIAMLEDQLERIADIQSQYKQSMRRYSTDPATKNLARMYRDTIEELDALRKQSFRPESDWSTSVLRQYSDEIKRLEAEVKRQLDQVQRSMPQYMNYLSLMREREQKQASLVDMQRSLNSFALLSETANEPVQIVWAAVEPSEPVGPKRKLYLAMVVMLGLGAGVGLVCLLESVDRRIRMPEHLVSGVSLPLFGVVPRMRRLAELYRGGHLWTPGLPHSVEADAFRNLRASLLAATCAEGRSVKALLVTSPKQSEGKSTTALNLAATCARCGERTLLIDADLRRPSLSPVFETTGQDEVGLVDVLQGELPWQRALVRTEIPTLDFLPCGNPDGVPVEVLGTYELAQMIKSITGHYHRVIIDGPAVLGMADCRMLGRVADAALLVVRSGTQSVAPVQRARALLEQSRVHIAGLVFNGLDEDLEDWGGLVTHLPVRSRSPRSLETSASAADHGMLETLSAS